MIVDSQSLGLAGLGQSCPSTEQLQGVQDCSDPCQASQPPCVSAGTTTTSAANALATAASLATCTAAGGVWQANGTCTAAPVAATTTIGGIPAEVVAIGGGLFLLLALMLGGRR